MTAIGNFTKQGNGYQGTIATLTLRAKLSIVQVEKANEKAPDFRVYADKAEIGAAWTTTSKAGNKYLSVKLDDLSFANPVQCRLVEGDDGYTLLWSR